MKPILSIISSLALLLPVQAQSEWQEISCARPNLVVQGPYENPSNKVDTSLEALRSLNKNYWFAYYTNSNWNDWSGVDEDNHFYLISSVTMNGWDKVFGGTQLVKRFELPASEIQDAAQVRVSFDVMKVIPIGFDASVKPWVASAPLSEMFDVGALASNGNSVFNFSLISLKTGNTILSNVGANWHHSGVDYDRNTISFILEGEDLYAADYGYALSVTCVYDGAGTSNMDCYVFENTRVEKLLPTPIPEPATALFGVMGLAGMMVARRRN